MIRWQVECDPRTEASNAVDQNPREWEFRSKEAAQVRAEKWHTRGAVGVIGFRGRACVSLSAMDERGWWTC